MIEKNKAIEIRTVSQVFRTGFWLKQAPVLFDVSFDLFQNRVMGLLGANGAGKTTLIKLIAGLRRPTSGEILIFGKPATTNDAKRKIGFVPERPYFYEFLTGRKLLFAMGSLSQVEPKTLKQRIDSISEEVGISYALDKELKTYSKGMLQRIGITQALLADPDILILDEPMSGLDPKGRREIKSLITRLKGKGKTILMTSHLLEDVEAVCDEVVLLEKGRLTKQGQVSELLKEYESLEKVLYHD